MTDRAVTGSADLEAAREPGVSRTKAPAESTTKRAWSWSAAAQNPEARRIVDRTSGAELVVLASDSGRNLASRHGGEGPADCVVRLLTRWELVKDSPGRPHLHVLDRLALAPAVREDESRKELKRCGYARPACGELHPHALV